MGWGRNSTREFSARPNTLRRFRFGEKNPTTGRRRADPTDQKKNQKKLSIAVRVGTRVRPVVGDVCRFFLRENIDGEEEQLENK